MVYLDLELFAKIKKTWFLHSFLTLLLITQDLNKIKKNPEHPFVDIVKLETCEKFQQEILNFVAVGASQSFQFFRQIAWFLRNNRAFFKFSYQILYNLISITKLQNNYSIKANFNLITRATLSGICMI